MYDNQSAARIERWEVYLLSQWYRRTVDSLGRLIDVREGIAARSIRLVVEWLLFVLIEIRFRVHCFRRC